jgi:tetratricopeptide (TPR) repeat protein
MDAQEIYTAVEELSRFGNICLCITSRITTVPSDCETLDISTLSIEAARDTFYRIYKHGERSDPVSNILEQLDFHPLSITLLTTIAHHSKWNVDRLTKEWESQRTAILHTKHSRSLTAAIELSLSSPMFQELGPDARDLLGVVAFFPRGVNENNLDWLFPTIPNRTNVFDTFCILSLTHQDNGFITMLAPLRDYLHPKDFKSSPLLCTTKAQYFHRLSTEIYPGKPGFDEARWITSEDVNVEYLLDVFTSIDTNSEVIWGACSHFMAYLDWHKPRLIILGPKIKGLPDDHPSKAKCMSRLAWLFHDVGNHAESKHLLIHGLRLWREQGDDLRVAETLWSLSATNRMISLYEEGILQGKDALEIYERLNNIPGQARALSMLVYLFHDNEQLDAAEGAAWQVISNFSGKGERFHVCKCYRILGNMCYPKGETEKAIDYFKSAPEIASFFNWHTQLLWIHKSLADLDFDKGRFDDAHTHIEHAKSYAVNDEYRLCRMVEHQALFLYLQRKFEEARSATSHAAEVYERLGATQDAEDCRVLLRRRRRGGFDSCESDFNVNPHARTSFHVFIISLLICLRLVCCLPTLYLSHSWTVYYIPSFRCSCQVRS